MEEVGEEGLRVKKALRRKDEGNRGGNEMMYLISEAERIDQIKKNRRGNY